MGPTPTAGSRAVALARRYVDRDGLDGGWFALGGSSIDAARLVTALDQELGVRLSLRDLLGAGSVEDCLLAAERAGLATAAPMVPATPPSGPAPAPGPAASRGTASRSGTPAPSGSVADLVWPALAVLPAGERVKLAYRLLGGVVAGSAGPSGRPGSG